MKKYFFFYFLIFLAFFWQFPASDSVPGNCDTFFAISYSNTYLNNLKALFTGLSPGSLMYPTPSIYGFGETAFATAIIFIFFKLFLGNDLYCYYLFCVTIFTLTSLSFSLFISTYIKNRYLIFFSGLIFSLSNFTLANIDSIHTVFFAISFLSLYFFRCYLKTPKKRDLYLAFILCGFQIYFSAYVFLLTVLILGFMILLNFKKIKDFLLPGMIMLIITFPFLLFYFNSINSKRFFNPWNLKFISELHSLNSSDLLRKIPGNIYNRNGNLTEFPQFVRDLERIRAEGHPEYSYAMKPHIDYQSNTQDFDLNERATINFPYIRRSAFIGFILYILALIGFFASNKKLKIELGGFFLIGLIFSHGPLNLIGGQVFPTPMYLIYEYLDMAKFFRIPSRAFFISQIAVIILAMMGLRLLLKKKINNLVLTGVLFLILIENVPFSMTKFKNHLSPPKGLAQFFKSKREKKVILDLPSDLGLIFVNDYDDFFSYSREIIYMNYQSYHLQNSINGINGYLPKTRYEVQKDIDKFQDSGILGSRLKSLGVNNIIYHKKLALNGKEIELLKKLKSNQQLKMVLENEELAIFNISLPN